MAHASIAWSPQSDAANRPHVYLLRTQRFGSCHRVYRSQQRMCQSLAWTCSWAVSVLVKVCLMKMFPYTFALASPVQEPVLQQQIEAIRPQHCAKGDVPANLDIERLVAVMRSASACTKNAQQCRRELIKKLPQETIDWNTVNWVALWPFTTRRH